MGGLLSDPGRVKVGLGLLGWLFYWESGALLRERQVWVAGRREVEEHRTREAKAGKTPGCLEGNLGPGNWQGWRGGL